MKIVVLYKGFNAMSEGVQIVLLASVSGITDRYVRVSAVKGMEIIHMQRIGGGITRTLMDGIVQNELFVGADLGIICLLYTSPSPRDRTRSRMPSSA